jgi:phospholipase C
MRRRVRIRYLTGLVLAVVAAVVVAAAGLGSSSNLTTASASNVNNSADTTTPIKHVVVIFDENETFDHYFGTYPYAANSDGTTFCPAAGTAGLPGSSQTVNTELDAGLVPASTLGAAVTAGNCSTYQGALPNPEAGPTPPVANTAAPNPNEYQPQRIPDTAAVTCDNNHSYTPEEEAEDGGKMDDFVQFTSANCTIPGVTGSSPGIGMDYFDGNAVTGLWNYAQNYAMSDNSWDATFGPTMIGSINMFGATNFSTLTGSSYISNTNPVWDDIDGQSGEMGGDNIGTLLNDKGVSWGWFEQGFSTPGTTVTNVNGGGAAMFSSIYDAPDWWQSTSNEDHTAPASPSEIGFPGPANHQYDTPDFTDALNGTGGATLPAVSFLRADEVNTGHPSVSDPLDEQKWITQDINSIEQSPYWPSTAIVIEYDDSDGYYDHQAPTIINSSNTGNDSAICTNAFAAGVPEIGGHSNSCGPSQRLPFLVISPYAKHNYVDHSLTTQVSTLKFIEQNWGLPTIGGATFDNLSQVGNLDSFFDWSHPQQNEVLLDSTCNAAGLTVVANTCNNTTAHAATDGVVDNGTTTDAGFGAVQATPSVTVPTPPTVTVTNSTITVPSSATGTLSDSALLNAVGASASEGTPTADASDVNLQIPGTYTGTVSAAYDYTSTGVNGNSVQTEIDSISPQTVTVNVVPTVSVANATLTYTEANPPTAAQVLSASGASINGGTLADPDLSGVDFSTPGSYTVSITGSENGEQATAVPVTINVIPTPVIDVVNPTVYYQVGQSPTLAQVLADAGISINVGSVSMPDLSGVNFAKTGTYTVTVHGSADGFNAAPLTLTVNVVSTPAIQLSKATVAYLVGSNPSSSQVLQDAGAQIDHGSLAVDLSPVNFGQAGSYTVNVTGSDNGAAAHSLQLTVRVVDQPVVTLGSSVIDAVAGSTLTSDQVLTDAGAVVSDGISNGGMLNQVDLSGVNFGQAGSYSVNVTGGDDGLTATPATLTIKVVAVPKVSVTDNSLSYPSGANVDAAEVLSASGATTSDSGDVFVDLSGVDFNAPRNYSVQITGAAEGIAATPATVAITVRPVVTMQSHTLKLEAGATRSARAVLHAAGARISAGSLTMPNLTGVSFTEAGIYKVQIKGVAHGVDSHPVVLTIVVKPRLSVAKKLVRLSRNTHLTAKILIAKTGARMRDGGNEKLSATFGHVKPGRAGTYGAQIVAIGDHGQTAASVSVHVVVAN